ncbi:MAG TPA: hypothetical protein VN429_08680 [Methanospirillum sp.]|uniref:hypothetical protein n=1 Tax=Methanospirillum sp. TaxID=45200 RepID=UPI002C6E2476|nr:hypothetical protein [Methanospirillum sp.]HWQ64479.1 hypothetical protein [Methanospirillum sp.]
MSGFVEKISHSGAFELCGRIIRDGTDLVIFIDGTGRFVISEVRVLATLMGLGESEISGPAPGVARLLRAGEGFTWISVMPSMQYRYPVSELCYPVSIGKDR